MTALETLREANRLCEEFARGWFNRYAPHAQTSQAAYDLQRDLEAAGFELSRATDYGQTDMLHVEFGIHASVTVDRAGGDGPRATAWAHVSGFSHQQSRLIKQAQAAKRAETRLAARERESAMARISELEAALASRPSAVVAPHLPAVQKPTPAAAGADRFQLIELE